MATVLESSCREVGAQVSPREVVGLIGDNGGIVSSQCPLVPGDVAVMGLGGATAALQSAQRGGGGAVSPGRCAGAQDVGKFSAVGSAVKSFQRFVGCPVVVVSPRQIELPCETHQCGHRGPPQIAVGRGSVEDIQVRFYTLYQPDGLGGLY